VLVNWWRNVEEMRWLGRLDEVVTAVVVVWRVERVG
jgi:hypothetical protein